MTTGDQDEARREEDEARERLRDAEADAKETLEEAEQLEQDDAEADRRNDSGSD